MTLVKPAPSRDGTGRAGDAAAGSRNWSALMARAQDGDRAAYRTLLLDMTPYLRRLAARCFRDPLDVEDAVQDILLTVHTVRHAYDPSRPFGPWLVALANRRLIDRLRRETRQRTRQIELDATAETFAADPANLKADETADDAATLHKAIEQLPPDQGEAIRLLKLKEMSLREAALASGRSVAALKVATHRGIKSLRRLLGRTDEQL